MYKMRVNNLRTATILLILSVAPIVSSSRCSFMTEIPRPERPNQPEQDFEGVPWSERPILPVEPEREDVCVDDYPMIQDGSNIYTQAIFMDEEIVGDVTIAKLNYNGNDPPEIVQPMNAGQFNLLGPVFHRSEDGYWHLIITEKQDFETPIMRVYMFDIEITGDNNLSRARVSLAIVNIDDNDPIIQAVEPCAIEELGEPRLTECVYTVTDADGPISTMSMQFEITSTRRRDEEIFYTEHKVMPNDVYRIEMTLGINEALNFETNALHVFDVTAKDSGQNNHTVNLMVRVINVEHRPPRWVEIFQVQQFDEMTNQSFRVRAIDGDTGIDKPIYYKLRTHPDDTFFSIETIEGGEDGAIFKVSAIDRDTLQREMFEVTIIAYKYDNESFATENDVVIIVNDINNKKPEPFKDDYFIDIMEETAQTLAFDESIGFHDKDLGENAQYTVSLEDVEPPGAASAFYIAPEVGYQKQTFIMGTLNHSMLDYEVEEFQNITIKVVAVDMGNPDFIGVSFVHINLINWNDEEPIFEELLQTVAFDETEGEGFFVATVRAHDRDIGDRVEHSLLGNAGSFLTIEEDTGNIYVSANDSFDYHRQNELFIQVQAIDTLGEPYHTATSQLVIQLNDINNTPPTLTLGRGSLYVQENVPENHIIEWEIHGSDPDTTAELHFEIDWETSYATKNGRETDPREFHGCIDIDTLYPTESNRGIAVGQLLVKEIRDNVTIDFEEFEVLYLTVRVRDVKTVSGDDFDEATLTITIIDMNDNRPEWVSGTLDQSLRVTEMATTGTVIGSVLATDIDGPLYNQVRYTIRPDRDTPENLVTINIRTGQITVDANEAIDADVPPRYYLTYVVTATDKCDAEDCPDDDTYWETDGEISIEIIDTNNKVPKAETDQYNETVYIFEDAIQGTPVVQLVSSDLDRDEIYHNVSYQINYGVAPRLRDFFAVDLFSGLIYVDYTTDEVLDRDGDEPEHEIFLTLIDNFLTEGDGRRNQEQTTVRVVLRDINDNAPQMPDPSTLPWNISENAQKGTPLAPLIFAPDRDEPGTDNSLVGYEIVSITNSNNDNDVSDLFDIKTLCDDNGVCRGELSTNKDLRGFWGTYDILIKAFDHGDPPLSSNDTYKVEVVPYNFHQPEFQFPVDGSTIRLARERAVVNGVLVMVDGEFLPRVHATDEDGLHAGTVTFTVYGNEEARLYFDVVNESENYGMLTIIEPLGDEQEPQVFQLSIRATDGGTDPGPLSTLTNVQIAFVPTQGDPVFNVDTITVAFVEGEQGLEERFPLPRAEDPKNYLCDEDCYDIFYRIIDGNDDDLFALDAETNELYLLGQLDRSVTNTHELLVAASNSLNPGAALTGSILTVTVNVREADPRPYFLRDLYTAGISTANTINWEILTVQAQHSEGDTITYSIDQESMVVDPSLSAVRDSAFELNPVTGVLVLNMQPTASMHGMFEFDVIATDSAEATDKAEVKIYLISSRNRVYFTFVNTVQDVEDHRDFIEQTFSVGFGMTCNIDQVMPASDDNGVALTDRTSVLAHFIRDDMPVPAEEIERLREDTLLLRSIQMTLNMELLLLEDFVTDLSPVATDSSLTTVYVLAGLCGLLAFLCALLLLAFFVRTRALNRRLQALSMTKYGSVDSGLNRAGLPPGTNKHAVEGSNPIWNETVKAPDFDAISDASGDSDLIGVEDMPQFSQDMSPVDTSSTDAIIPPKDTVATHSNQFGFNITPFSSDFTHSFKR